MHYVQKGEHREACKSFVEVYEQYEGIPERTCLNETTIVQGTADIYSGLIQEWTDEKTSEYVCRKSLADWHGEYKYVSSYITKNEFVDGTSMVRVTAGCVSVKTTYSLLQPRHSRETLSKKMADLIKTKRALDSFKKYAAAYSENFNFKASYFAGGVRIKDSKIHTEPQLPGEISDAYAAINDLSATFTADDFYISETEGKWELIQKATFDLVKMVELAEFDGSKRILNFEGIDGRYSLLGLSVVSISAHLKQAYLFLEAAFENDKERLKQLSKSAPMQCNYNNL